MKFTLPQLPYAFDALEPYIDAKTMEIHYTKHHQAYVDNLNKALEEHPKSDANDKTLVELIENLDSVTESIRTQVRNNGGGHYNHSLFWQMMKKNGGGQPKGPIAQEIQKKFGSFEQFQTQFNETAKKVFGSGWAWLVLNTKGDLEVVPSHNQDSPLTHGNKPLLGLDVWEHAYYLKYQNKRPDYISAWWHVIDWDFVEDAFKSK